MSKTNLDQNKSIQLATRIKTKLLGKGHTKFLGKTQTKLLKKKMTFKSTSPDAIFDDGVDYINSIYSFNRNEQAAAFSQLQSSLNKTFSMFGMKTIPSGFIKNYHGYIYGTHTSKSLFAWLGNQKKDSFELYLRSSRRNQLFD